MTHDRVPMVDMTYVHKHDALSMAVVEYDDAHASDEFVWLDDYEPLSPASRAIVDALMMAYPDKF